MPQVPGTKVWVRNKDLASAHEAMEKACPHVRIKIVEELAEETVHRSRQAFETNYHRVHRFIVISWFNMHLRAEEKQWA